MNYGRFFEFDFESSYPQKGIAVFNYRWLKEEKSDNKKSPRYPIYLTITPESLSFNLHYLHQDDNNDYRHYHNTIIELRLSPSVDVANGLIESINNAYDAQFPFKEKDGVRPINDYLLCLIKKSFQAQDCPVGGYSSLDGFEPETEKNFDKNNEGKKPHLLRKIILDFLFDMEFTNVFKNVAFYDDLSTNLKSNFIFNALMNKARYYYYRTELCAKEVIDCCESVDDKDINKCDQGLKFFFEQYTKAEHDWVTSIIDERSMKVFHDSPWFNESYKELEQVYFSSRTDRWLKKDEKRKIIKPVPRIAKVVSFDKSKQKKETRLCYLRRINALNDSFKLTVGNMLNLTRKKSPGLLDDNVAQMAVATHCNTAKMAASWEVEHYHFKGLWKLWFGDVSTMIWSLLFGVFLVLMAFNWFALMYKNTTVWHSWSFVIAFATVLVLLIGIGGLIRRYYRSTWGMGSLSLLMPRLLAAVVTAWFTMSMSEDLFRHFALDESNHLSAVIILSMATLLFVGHESKLLNPYDTLPNVILSSVLVFIVAYFYSVIVGLMVFDFFGNNMIHNIAIDYRIDCISLQDNWEALPSDLQKMMAQYSELINSDSINSIKFPFVFRFSFFATFIGIFLQLMLQGKSVTGMK